MQIKRKNIIICSMILLLFIIGYAYNSFTSSRYISSYDLNFQETSSLNVQDEENNDNTDVKENKDGKDPGTGNKQSETTAVVEIKNDAAIEASSSSFFSEYRLERDKNRSREVEMWQDIINSQSSEKNFKNLAQQELVKIVALTEKEMIIENLIVSRGFNDALVFLTDDSATVIVDSKELTKTNVAQIQDIIVRKTKLEPANIKIMKKN